MKSGILSDIPHFRTGRLFVTHCCFLAATSNDLAVAVRVSEIEMEILARQFIDR